MEHSNLLSHSVCILKASFNITVFSFFLFWVVFFHHRQLAGQMSTDQQKLTLFTKFKRLQGSKAVTLSLVRLSLAAMASARARRLEGLGRQDTKQSNAAWNISSVESGDATTKTLDTQLHHDIKSLQQTTHCFRKGNETFEFIFGFLCVQYFQTESRLLKNH